MPALHHLTAILATDLKSAASVDAGVLFTSLSRGREAGCSRSIKQHPCTRGELSPWYRHPLPLSSPLSEDPTPRCTARKSSSPTSARTAPRPSPAPPPPGPAPPYPLSGGQALQLFLLPEAFRQLSHLQRHTVGEWRATTPPPLACPPHRPDTHNEPLCRGGENPAGGESWHREGRPLTQDWRHQWTFRDLPLWVRSSAERRNDYGPFLIWRMETRWEQS